MTDSNQSLYDLFGDPSEWKYRPKDFTRNSDSYILARLLTVYADSHHVGIIFDSEGEMYENKFPTESENSAVRIENLLHPLCPVNLLDTLRSQKVP